MVAEAGFEPATFDDIPEAHVNLQRNPGVGHTGFERYSHAFVCLFNTSVVQRVLLQGHTK